LIYDTFSENRVRLLGFAINQKMMIINEFHTALIPLTRKDLESFEHKIGDTEGIVNFPLSIENINLSIMLSEREDLIRLSFRSKGKFPANQVAREYFEGGGHINAAGGNSYVSMEETIQKIINILPLFKTDLDFIIS
jgi:phosphoesterase RecJ-like protein